MLNYGIESFVENFFEKIGIQKVKFTKNFDHQWNTETITINIKEEELSKLLYALEKANNVING